MTDAALHALVVDDDEAALYGMTHLVEKQGFSTATASTWEEARRELASQAFDVLLLDVFLPGGTGIDLLLEVPADRRPAVILTSGSDAVQGAFSALPLSSIEFLPKPFDIDKLESQLRGVKRARARSRASEVGAERSRTQRLLGESVAIRRVRELIKRVSTTDLPVYLEGESGTGKELVARAVHECSRRSAAPFVAINCGAIPDSLIDSELFGHTRGAFTGADQDKEGVFEQAHGGTLFLDEVSEMPIDLQVRLLRVLEQRRVRRVGGKKDVDVDVRIISATNRPFGEAIEKGKLREDLFHRLCVFPIVTPPLRDRPEDVAVLARIFTEELGMVEGRQKKLSPEVLEALRRNDWPGNVRQLRNAIQRAYVLADEEIRIEHLPHTVHPPARQVAAGAVELGAIKLKVGTSMAEAEQRLIEATLLDQGGNKKATADILGVSLRTLYNRLNQYAGAGETETIPEDE
jgi:DNA-binding NtrC family response regulator